MTGPFVQTAELGFKLESVELLYFYSTEAWQRGREGRIGWYRWSHDITVFLEGQPLHRMPSGESAGPGPNKCPFVPSDKSGLVLPPFMVWSCPDLREEERKAPNVVPRAHFIVKFWSVAMPWPWLGKTCDCEILSPSLPSSCGPPLLSIHGISLRLLG